MTVKTILASPEDIPRLLAVDLRRGDKMELEGSRGIPWRDAYQYALASTDLLWFSEDTDTGNVLAVFGLKLNSEFSSPWMLCTPFFEEVPPRRVMVISRKMLKLFSSFNLPMLNTVCVQNVAAVKWLYALGASWCGKPYRKVDPRLTYQDFELTYV